MTTTPHPPRPPRHLARRVVTGSVALAACLGVSTALAGSASAATGFFNDRIAGPTRVETAVAASTAQAPQGASAVVVVNKDRTVDGLTASYVAGLHDAPVLYTTGTAVPAATTAEITRLGAKTVYIVGGPAVVPQAQADAWRASGHTVVRYGGTTRYGTAALVATSGTATPSRVWVADGEGVADALDVGPIAYQRHEPILLTRPASVPSETSAALVALRVSQRTVVGGPKVVQPATYTALQATLRLSGDTRQGTAVAVAGDAIAHEGFGTHSLALVSGEDAHAADALVAAGVAGAAGAPLVFTSGATLGPVTSGYLRDHTGDLTGTGYVFGGLAAVPGSVVDAADTAAADAIAPTFRTTPTTKATLSAAAGDTRRYTVTGLNDTQVYEVATIPADDAFFYPDGSITFHPDPDAGAQADGLGATRATVSYVDGAAQASGTHAVRGVHPVGGTISFTLTSTAADRVNPVVFNDLNGNAALDLSHVGTGNPLGKPSAEPFAVGGETDWR